MKCYCISTWTQGGKPCLTGLVPTGRACRGGGPPSPNDLFMMRWQRRGQVGVCVCVGGGVTSGGSFKLASDGFRIWRCMVTATVWSPLQYGHRYSVCQYAHGMRRQPVKARDGPCARRKVNCKTHSLSTSNHSVLHCVQYTTV
jgi:hypothetical protein